MIKQLNLIVQPVQPSKHITRDTYGKNGYYYEYVFYVVMRVNIFLTTVDFICIIHLNIEFYIKLTVFTLIYIFFL